MAILLGGLAFYIQERVLPPAALKCEELLNRINDLPDKPDSGISRRWAANARRDRFYHFRLFDVRKEAWREMSVFDLDAADWTIRRRFYAAEATYENGVLLLRNGWLREFKGAGMETYATFEEFPLEVPEGRDLFWAESKSPGQMTYGELRKYTSEVKALGLDSRRLSVDLNSKLSFPLVALIMTLLGIPFAFSMGRRGALVGIGVSLALSMVFWVTIGIFRSLGYVGYLSVFLAAWGPALIFGLLGIYLSLRLRT
jgi:lipopolysaccharide export LptBFGC system permease protein LptF